MNRVIRTRKGSQNNERMLSVPWAKIQEAGKVSRHDWLETVYGRYDIERYSEPSEAVFNCEWIRDEPAEMGHWSRSKTARNHSWLMAVLQFGSP